MPDIKGCVVAFEHDIREDGAKAILNTIRMIKGVKSVNPNIATPDDWINRQQIKHDLQMKLFKTINDL